MSATLLPNGKASFVDSEGQPLVGGRLYTYLAGTSTPAPTWADANQTAINTNPIILDARGEASIFWSGNYKVSLHDALDAPIWTQDNVSPQDITGFVTAASLAASGGSNLIGFIQGGAGALLRTAQSKMREQIGYGDHSTLSQSITYAGAARDIDMAGQTATLGVAPTNQYGTRFRQGKVLIPSGVGDFTYQQNTYADDANGLMIGRENLATWWKYVSAGLFQNVILYGDSTVETNNLYPFKPHQLFKMALLQAGVNNCLTINKGVSGTSWSDLNALPDLGPTTRLIVIKYGINDAVKPNALATMAADMRAKLTAIRADTDGGFDQLSILLMGPNSIFAPEYGQDSTWCESVRNLYLQICKEFDCAYFDTYAFLQSSHLAPGLWLLEDFPPNQGIHPDQVSVFWIWFEGIKTHVLGEGAWNVQKSNNLWNVDHGTLARLVTEVPGSYPFGWHQYGVLAADGPGPEYWPTDGHLIVHRSASGGSIGQVTQWLTTLGNMPVVYFRTGTNNIWTQWVVLPATVTGSKIWDPPSVANGATASTTVPLFGVLATDRISVSHSSIVAAGWFLSAVRSAVDTVTVTILNQTGGAVDLASGTLTVTAMRTS